MVGESRFPIVETLWRNGETGRIHLPGAASAAARARPGKKSNGGSGMARVVAIIKMISRWIVEIDRPFSETKPQNLRVKIDVLLRIGAMAVM